jgi:hypothetical protein
VIRMRRVDGRAFRSASICLVATLLTGLTACPDEAVSITVERVETTVHTGPRGGVLRLLESEPVAIDFIDPQAFAEAMDGYRIVTDDAGEALLRGRYGLHACEVYVYRDGDMVTGSCSRHRGCNEDLLYKGSYYYDRCSAHVITGPELAEVRVGSRLAVSVDPARRVMLVIVKAGDVRVAPVVDASTGALGTFAPVPADAFWFITPGGRPIAGLEAGRAHPIGLIDPVVAELGLEAFVRSVRSRFGVALDQPDARIVTRPIVTFEVTTPPIGSVGATSLPDLIVSAFEVVGSVERAADGSFTVPVRVEVANIGGRAAPVFKIAAEHVSDLGPFLTPFVLARETVWFPFTSEPLPARATVEFLLGISVPDALAGRVVELRVSADSCAGEEFAAAHCRVEESDETNNTATVELPLPGRTTLR